MMRKQRGECGAIPGASMTRKTLPNTLALTIATVLGACASAPAPVAPKAATTAVPPTELYGTLEPFAADAIYFVLTDRFVNGDVSNDQRDQGRSVRGGKFATFDRPTPGAPATGEYAGYTDNVGYLGGDFRGVLDNSRYIKDLGFGAVWITPIVQNPDEAFSGGTPVVWAGKFTDGGKTGFHGYWGTNFYRLDEHLPSANLDFKGLTAGLKAQGLKTVLDIVCNHGSPAFSMPVRQPGYGQIFAADGTLIADQQNLPGAKLDPQNNPLHAFYHAESNLVQLSDVADENPAVMDYFVGAYLQWIEQGADALRIDTIRQMPHAFWRTFSARIREKHPGFFMFGEAFDYSAEAIAEYTLAKNAGVSVLDFPLKAAIETAFTKPEGGYGAISDALYLQDSPYANPYELMTFYDNHDVARLKGTDAQFINANNLLFTMRGIPVIYYGSEMGFMRGTAEHEGNRNYFGVENIAAAPKSPIFAPLQRIAKARAANIALQRGVQLNISMDKDYAAFLRVYQHDGTHQTALVLLNKSSVAKPIALRPIMPTGPWRDVLSGAAVADLSQVSVEANGVRVLVQDQPIRNAALVQALAQQMAFRR
jgi:glycosidase